MTDPFIQVRFNPEAFDRLKLDIERAAQVLADAMQKSGFYVGPKADGRFNWDEYFEEQRREQEELFKTRRRQAKVLTFRAKVYGFRDAMVVWMTGPEQFAFIYLDDLTCTDVPQIGDNFDDALHWIRAEARGDHDE